MLFGLEVIAVLALVLFGGGAGIGLVFHLESRRWQHFLVELHGRARAVGLSAHGEDPGVHAPPMFTLGPVGAPWFVQVALVERGESALWHVTFAHAEIAAPAFALVEDGWRAPDCVRMPDAGSVAGLTVQAPDARAAHEAIAAVVSHLAPLVSCHVHVCAVREGRVFLEVDRTSHDVDEAFTAVRRAAVVAELFGAPRSPLAQLAPASTHAGAPDGAPLLVPALLSRT
jgi:hypothetical protein